MRAALRTAMLQGVPLSTRDLYNTPITTADWSVPTAGAARFSWEYDDGRDRLLALYQKGKDKQWDSAKRIDWTSRSIPSMRSASPTSRWPSTAPSTGTR